jgi:hypothetical protein
MSRDYIGNIRTFETRNFRVSVDAEYDYDVDTSFDETGETQRKIDDGDLIAFQVVATVTHKPTGAELGTDYLGGCIYESIEAFEDHRACGRQNRRRIRREGRYQIYRKNRKYESILTRKDKLRKRGFATRERAQEWAQANVNEPFEIHEAGMCGSYFKDMIHTAIAEARKELVKLSGVRVRAIATACKQIEHKDGE